MAEQRLGIGEALLSHDAEALRGALAASDLVVLYTETPGGRAPVILTDAEGRTAVAAFTGQATLDAFQTPALVGVVRGSEVAALAMRQGVDVVLIDPAGPHPFSFAPRHLQDIVDGVATGAGDRQVLLGEQAFTEPAADERTLTVRQALRDLLPSGAEAYLIDRVVDDHRVLTAAIVGSEPEVAALAQSLAKRLTMPVDVVCLSEDVRAALAEQAPQCRVLF